MTGGKILLKTLHPFNSCTSVRTVSCRLTSNNVSGYDTKNNPGYARCATVGVLE